MLPRLVRVAAHGIVLTLALLAALMLTALAGIVLALLTLRIATATALLARLLALAALILLALAALALLLLVLVLMFATGHGVHSVGVSKPRTPNAICETWFRANLPPHPHTPSVFFRFFNHFAFCC